MQILHRFEDGSFKAVIRKFEPEGVGSALFQKADYAPHMERVQVRASRGVLRGEMGNPRFSKHTPYEGMLQRLLVIHEDMVCCSFSDVKFERILDCGEGQTDFVEPKAFEAITAIVHPAGRLKDVFVDVVANPDLYEFAARGTVRIPGAEGPKLITFVTWDLIPASNLPNYYVQLTDEALEHS
jgi:hypothetical protein